LWPVLAEVEMNLVVAEAAMEAVKEVVFRKVDASGLLLEESMDVALQGLVLFLLALGKVELSSCFLPCALEVVDELPAQVILIVNGARLEAFQPCERRGSQGDQEVSAHHVCASLGSLDGCSVNA
jgi:hypothetical protein